MKQPDKLTAYYFRAALQTDTLYLDNQMQRLLYHASQNGIAAFALYADNGYNGLNFDRPRIFPYATGYEKWAVRKNYCGKP